MRESIQAVAALYARTFTTIARAPRLPTQEEIDHRKWMSDDDWTAKAKAKIRRQQRADRKHFQVEVARAGQIGKDEQ